MPSLMKMMAEMGLNINPFQAGLKGAEHAAAHSTEMIAHHVKGLVAGYFGFEAIKHGFEEVAERAIRISQLSKQFSVSTDEVQKLGIAAEHAGLDFEAFGAGLDKLGAARKEAIAGNERLIYIFNRLGVGALATDLERVSDLDLSKKIGEAFSKMEINSETREFLRELMGRGGPRLLEVLKGIEHTEHEAIISKEDIDNIHEAEIALKGLQRQWATFIAPKEANIATFWKNVMKDLDGKEFANLTGHDLARAYFQNLFNINKDEDVHVNNALPRTKREKPISNKRKYLAPDGVTVIREEEIPENERGGNEAKPIVSPHQTTEMLKAQFALGKRIEDIAFGRANELGKIKILEEQINNSALATVNLKFQLLNHTITQEEYERLIAENKLDQLNAEEKIYEIKRRGAIGSEGFRKLARAGGTNPADYKAAGLGAPGANTATDHFNRQLRVQMQGNQILQFIHRALQSGGIVFGGGR